MGLDRFFSKAISFLFSGLFFLVPLFFTPYNSELFEFNKILLVYGFTVLILASWIARMFLQKNIIFRRTPLDIPLFLFFLSQIFSTLFSIDPHTSIFGYYSRFNGGLLSTASFLFLYWAIVSNSTAKDVLKFIKITFVSALIVSFYGILEHFGHSFSCLFFEGKFDVSCWIQDVKSRVFATIGQPNWLAAYLAILLPISLAFSLNQEPGTMNKGKKYLSPIIHYSLFIILFLCLLFTVSRSGFLGLGVSLIIFWLFFFLTKLKKLNSIFKPVALNALIITACLLVFGTPFSQINRYLQFKNWFSKAQPEVQTEAVSNQPSEPQLESGGTESGIIRKIVWTGAMGIFKAHPILGSGPETFAYSYYNFRPMEHNLVSEWDFLYNKAHNEYLNYLSTTGIIGLGTYLVFIIAFIIWNIRQFKILNFKFLNNKETHNSLFIIQYSLFAGWVSILVSNFFGFSVVLVSLYFYLIPAFAFVLSSDNSSPKMQSKIQPIPLVPLLLITCYLLLAIINLWRADYHYSLGQKLNKRNDYVNGYQQLAKAVEISPNEPVFLNELSTATANTALLSYLQSDENAANLAKAAAYYSDLALEKSPKNLNIYKSRVKVLYTLAQIDESYLNKSIETINTAIVLAPTDPKLVYNLGLLYGRKGMVEEALDTIKKAIEMKPNYEEARNALAIFYEDLGMNKEAIEQLEIIYKTKKDDPSLLERIEKLRELQ